MYNVKRCRNTVGLREAYKTKVADPCLKDRALSKHGLQGVYWGPVGQLQTNRILKGWVRFDTCPCLWRLRKTSFARVGASLAWIRISFTKTWELFRRTESVNYGASCRQTYAEKTTKWKKRFQLRGYIHKLAWLLAKTFDVLSYMRTILAIAKVTAIGMRALIREFRNKCHCCRGNICMRVRSCAPVVDLRPNWSFQTRPSTMQI